MQKDKIAKLAALGMFMLGATAYSSTPARISSPGAYSGYSEPIYSAWVRSSQYVPASDGTKLAVDIYRPAVNGKPVDTPYPVLFQVTQYRRAFYRPDHSIQMIAGDMLDLTRYGYVLVVADSRGEGASFGTRLGAELDHQEASDAYDVIEWTAKQPWSTGKTGMWGASYMGEIQPLAAAMKPPHLKAIVPQVFPFDHFDVFSTIVPPTGPFFERGDPDKLDPFTVPVDEDKDGSMLKAAIQEHRGNKSTGPLPYHDSIAPTTGTAYYAESASIGHVPEIEASGVAIYNVARWDNWLREGAFISFATLTNASKLTVLPTSRPSATDSKFDMVAEHHRFFDYWLKGIQNGIMSEPRVYLCTVNAGCRFDETWPPKQSKPLAYYFGSDSPAAPGSDSAVLTTAKPKAKGTDTYSVVYDLTSGNRDEKGLLYTSPEFTADTQITGYPIVHLWFSSTAKDGDFWVFLEDVDGSGKAQLITDGRLRASLRAVSEPPYKSFGVPWHRGNQADVAELTPGEVTELRFGLLPTSYVVKQGHRVRLNITCSAPANAPSGTEAFRAYTPRVDPPPVITIYRDSVHSSSITLPVTNEARGSQQLAVRKTK